MATPTLSQRVRHIIGDSFGASIVEQNLEKAIKEAKERATAPEATFYDPMSLFMGSEWMNRKSTSLSFNDLRMMAKNPIMGSIIQTRINQVAAFCSPQQDAYDYGFQIVTDEDDAKEDLARKQEIQKWIYGCGIPGYGEDNLETFARKFIRDSLVLDQACAEIVYRKNGTPAYVVTVDSATVRKLRASLNYATPPNSEEPLYVQVIQDQIVASFSYDQMIFGVRNPQSDITYAGYGMSELEMLMRVVTTILNTERYNSGQLNQGGTQKGILVVKGDAARQEMEVFKRDFREAIRNAAFSWRPPVLQVGKDAAVDWVTLDRSNRDMEYSQLFDFLVKQACGVYQIDPSEINWQIGQSGSRTTFESRQGEKQNLSKQRGLKPLLTFLSNQINMNLINRIDPRYRIDFVGVDQDRKTDVELREREVKSFKTVNEVRAGLNLEPIMGGDIILNEIFMKGVKEDIDAVPEKRPDAYDQDKDLEEEVDINEELNPDG